MNIDRTTVLSVALTVILVTSMFPASIVGTADAMPHRPNSYSVIQGTNCWEVAPYHPGDPNPDGPSDDPTIKPHVEIVERSHEMGTFRNSSWNGTPTIESVMDYRYRDPAGGIHDNDQPWGQRPHSAPWLSEPNWKEPWSFGTYGLYNWSENQESHMFFYNGPEGDSIVMRHDKLYDTTGIGSHGPYNGMHPDATRDGFHTPAPGRSAATFIFRDLPAGEWAYMDDLYPEGMDAIYYASGEFNYDPSRHTRYGTRHNDYGAAPLENYGGGTDFTAHWTWGEHGTDGGAYRGLQNLGPGESITIEPYFDEDSYYWSNYPWRYNRSDGDGITDWVIRRKNGENIHLDKTEPVEIRRGDHCPNAEFGFGTNSGTTRVEVGEQFALDARGSEGNSLRYNWDLDGDGQFDANTTSAVLPHTYDGSVTGNVTVTLMVEDPDGLQNTATHQIRVVPPESPDASVSVSGINQNSLNEYHVPNETLTFDATNTTDNGVLNASSAVWRVNGNVTAVGQMQYSHAFSETGDYQVSFTVSDEAGHNTTHRMTVSVDPLDTQNPNANAQITPREVEAGANVTFDGSGSGDNRGIQTYRWDLNGDGSVESTEETWVSQGLSQGDYNVTLEVEDGNGNVDNVTVPVTVMQSEPPNVSSVSFPDQVTLDEEFTLTVDASDNGRITDYTWQIISGDAPETTGNPATYAFSEDFDQLASERAFSVVVYVTDAAGNTEPYSVEKQITVLPRDTTAPDASLSVSTNQTKVGNDVTFNASESTDERNITAYHWDFDGNGTVERTTQSPVVSHSYDSTGTYNATVIVDDGSDSSANGTATVQIEVQQQQQAQQDSSSRSTVNTGPPPVNTDTEQIGPNAAVVDVKNARADETIESSLPDSEVASETGVAFERVAVDIASDDPHVVFETAASADAPESVTELTATDETLAYLELDAKYLDDGVENATVEFTVSESALGGLAESSDVVVYQYDGAWTQVNATLVETTEDGYRFAATADDVGTLAVGTDQPVSIADVELASDTVTSGETVTATATVENTGTEARSATVNLALDGNVVASETVEVAPGETEEVTLSGTAPTPGTYNATVTGVSLGTLTVEERQPADVSVTDVSLNASTIEAGGQVEITATVENTGDETGEQAVTLTMFGEELENVTVQVPGGETKEVTFVRQIDAGGTYTVDVNGETAEIDVTEEDDGETLGDRAPDVPGFGVGAALAALLAVALLARLRN